MSSTDHAERFRDDGYAIVRPLIGESLRSFLYAYVARLFDAGMLSKSDSQAPNILSCYGDPVMEALLESLVPAIGRLTGLEVCPTYSYFRVYKKGDVLIRHTDRPACQVSLTMTLGSESALPWPIWLETVGGARSISLGPGDALLYKGIEFAHWREAFQGDRLAQVFLHYVDRRGPYQEWVYDKRTCLRTSHAARHLIARFGT